MSAAVERQQDRERHRAFRLLTECCRQSFAGADSDRLTALSDGVDWRLFLAMTKRHRVEGIVANALREIADLVPHDLAGTLEKDAQRIAADGLAAALECRRMATAFEAAGVTLSFVKGLTLARLAYGNPFLKMAWDIDLLVAPADVASAARILRRLGYEAISPNRLDPEDAPRWHRRNKESVWRSSDGVHHVELHNRLADNARLISGLTAHSPSQMVEVTPGIALRTLAGDELFAYLCVHGGAGNWFRLKWAADLAAYVHHSAPNDLRRLIHRARELGAGRAVDQAVLLCAALFGEPFASEAAALRADRVARLLASAALTELDGPRSLEEPTERSFGTLRMHLVHLVLQRGAFYPFAEFTRKVAEQADRRRFG